MLNADHVRLSEARPEILARMLFILLCPRCNGDSLAFDGLLQRALRRKTGRNQISGCFGEDVTSHLAAKPS